MQSRSSWSCWTVSVAARQPKGTRGTNWGRDDRIVLAPNFIRRFGCKDRKCWPSLVSSCKMVKQTSRKKEALALGIFKKRKKKVEEDGLQTIEIPEETASLFKRLSSPGYLLLHPEMTPKAMILGWINCILYIAVRLVLACWLCAEIVDFIYLVVNYGFLH